MFMEMGKLTWEEAQTKVVPYYSFAPYIENLEETPHKTLADIAIQYIVPLESNDDSETFYRVTNELMNVWGITQREIEVVAEQNAQIYLVPSLCELSAIVFSLVSGESRGKHLNPVSEIAPGSLDTQDIYVLTCSSMLRGAPIIGNKLALERIAKGFGTGFYILPSSVHEVLIISTDHPGNAEDFGNMVKQVNATEVSAKDKLSDTLLIYSDGELKEV